MVEMKDSGIEWIGAIPKHWRVDMIKYHLRRNEPRKPINKEVEVLSVYREYGVIPKDSRDDNHNVTSEDTSKYKFVKKGDLVINKMKAWQGSLAVSDYEGIVSPAYFIYEFTDNQYNKKYFHYLVRGCYKDEFRRISGGIREGQWDLSAAEFSKTLILIPPIEEQDRIVNFINAKCSEIDLLYYDIEKQIETLEEYKKSVITEAVTKGLNPDVEMKESGIEWVGKMPSNWDVKKGKYCLTYVQKPTKEDDDVITCFRDGEVTLRSNRREEGFTISFKEIGYQGIDVGDLVVHGMDGFAGAIGISDSRGKASPVLNVLDTDNNKRYIMYYLRNMSYNGVFVALTTGIRVRTCDTNWGKLKELPYILPTIEEQNAIVKYIDDVINKVDAIIEEKKKQLEVLIDYKKSVIYEYVTGKKEVPDNERNIN